MLAIISAEVETQNTFLWGNTHETAHVANHLSYFMLKPL